MIVLLFNGGLGNQMFEYAFGKALENKGVRVYYSDYLINRNNQHNGYELNRLFNIYIPRNFGIYLLVRFFRKLEIFKNSQISKYVKRFLLLARITLIEEINDYVFDASYLISRNGLNLFLGYWQSEKYFSEISTEIRSKFSFDLSLLSIRSKDILKQIKSDENSVSIHVRRGDYLSLNSIYTNICTIAYYKKAILEITTRLKDYQFYVFSDDPQWVEDNLIIPNVFFVNWNAGNDSWQDMCLMSNCKHNIIANSSFSWWAAWLNSNPNKMVIAPSTFLNTKQTPDILPSSWIKINNNE